MTAPTITPPVTTTELDSLLANHSVRAVFQPIVDLGTREVVGYEALARGPQGSSLERPDLMFAAARVADRVAELDWACRAAAIRAALAAGYEAPLSLFLNAEPEALDSPPTPELAELWERARRELLVVVEITERALTARPAELLQSVTRIRENGWSIAVDDVGADRHSLALLPFLRPDVIKLDLRLVQGNPSADIAEIVNAANDAAERTGAVVLAEGIETEEHAEAARGMGARLGQGWLFGRPATLPVPLRRPSRSLARLGGAPSSVALRSPFTMLAEQREVRRARKPILIEMSKHLERLALALGETAVVIGAFQDASFFTAFTRERYAELARHAAFVGALGVGMDLEPAPGVRGARLLDSDPLVGEWNVAVIGPHFAAAFVGRDLGDSGPDLERRFDYVMTYERDLAIQVGHALMCRVWPDFSGLPEAAGDTPSRLPSFTTPIAPPAAPSLHDLVLRDRALAAANNGVLIGDATQPGFPIVYTNPAFERITGYGPGDVLGRSCDFLQGPDTDSAAVVEMVATLRAQSMCRVTLLNYRKDGTPFWNEVELSPVFDADGRLVQYVGSQADVSERVEAERALRTERDRAERYLDVAATMMVAIDPDEHVTLVNARGCSVLGYEERELIGANWFEQVLAPEDREGTRTAFARLLAGPDGRFEEHETTVLTHEGEERTIAWRSTLLRTEAGRSAGILSSGEDVTERRHAEREIAFLAYHDGLTGVANRFLLEEHLALALARSRRSGATVGLLYIDLDNFKLVNDALGHDAGDELLRQIARRLGGVTRASDLLARQGGDEFVVLLAELEGDGRVAAQATATQVTAAMAEPFKVAGAEFQIGASVGVGLAPTDAADPRALLSQADTEMYRVKAAGRVGYRPPEPVGAKGLERLSMTTRLRRALGADELSLHYQPIVSLADGAPTGVEALLRWADPAREGLVLPGEFIPVAEDAGLIDALSAWTVEEICRQAAAWHALGLSPRVALNASPRQLRRDALGSALRTALEREGLDPGGFVVQVTDSERLGDADGIAPVLFALHADGLGFAAHGLTTGVSAFGHRRELRIETLKIAPSFVRPLPDDIEVAEVAGAVLTLATALGMIAVAGGVESEAQRRFLLERGCQLGQGELFGRPMDAAGVTAFLLAGRR